MGPSDYELSGLIAGESVTVAPGIVANYADADAGVRIITANFTAPSNFVAGAGTLAANYIMPTTAEGPGTITPAPLLVLGVSAQNKVYDQTTVATLAGTASVFGVVAGDTVTLEGGSATGEFAQADVGTAIPVTVSGYDITGADAGNYQLFQPTGLNANITRRGLTIADAEALDKFYDGTTVAQLTFGALTGVLAGDTVNLDSGGTTASFLQKDVGVDLRVNVGGFAISGADAGNYSLTQPQGLRADISPLQLTGSILGTPTKTYDGTDSVQLTAANYTLSGFIVGEGGIVTQSAGSSYDSADAGSRTVTASLVVSDITPDPGTLLSNYLLPAPLTGPGLINRAPLAAQVIGNPTKVYDSTTAATLDSSNYQIAGFVAGQGATVNQTAGTYDQKNVGSRVVTSVLNPGDFTPDGGTNLANYTLPTVAQGGGTITAFQLQVIGVDAEDKEYDGTTAATLINTGADLDTVFAGDTVSLVTAGASGTFASKNVGTNIAVTATGYTISGADAANYTLLQPFGIAADIFAKDITLASVTKVYDADTPVPTVNSAYTLDGVVSGDTVTVDASAIVGDYADKNIGTGKSVTITSGIALGGADAGNYTIGTSVTNALIGVITPAMLTVEGVAAVNRLYNQSTTVDLDHTSTALAGVLFDPAASAFDDVSLVMPYPPTGEMQNPNAGLGKPVTVTGFNIQGVDQANYTLVQPDYVTVDIGRLPILLTSVVKVYDGLLDLPSAPSGYGFDGILPGDVVNADATSVTGGFLDKDVGGTLTGGVVTNGKDVSVSGLVLGGTHGGNYSVGPVVDAPIGVITPKQLTVSIVGNPTKVYDGDNTIDTLNNGNFAFEGFVLSESVTVTQQDGTFNSINVDEADEITASLVGEVTWDNALEGNYIVPTEAFGPGAITPASVQVIDVFAVNKVYNGNTDAALDNVAGPAGLSGVIAADVGTVTLDTSGAVGTFDSPNVGTAIPVTATGYALSGNDHGNYTLLQPVGLSADITAALLTLVEVTRVYNGLLTLPTDESGYRLSGIVSDDDVSVDATAAAAGATSGYADKDVGTNIGITIDTLQLTGAQAANYTVVMPDANIGTITRKDLQVAIIGDPTKVYNGSQFISTLTDANYQFTGFVLSEGVTVNQNIGAFNTKDVVTATTITATIGGFLAPDVGTDLGNYNVPTTAMGPGTITPATLTAAIINNPTKTYDGNVNATLGNSNYQLSGFFLTDGAQVTQTAGTYDSANAGLRTVTASLAGSDFSATGSTLLSNYVLPTSASGLGTIDPATLTAAIIGNPTKVYDGNTDATLTSTNYQLTGFVAGEGATVTETFGTYSLKDVGSRTVTATLDSTDFTATGSTLLSNYILPTSAAGPGTITRATLTASIIGNPTKTYDGNADAMLTSANYELTGFVAGEGATVDQPDGTYASPNAGVRLVTAALSTPNFTATGGTLLDNYELPTSASGFGTITQATLTAIIIGNPTKTYDGTTAATLMSTNYQLTGFVAGEGATVTETVGTYSLKDVGLRGVTATLDSTDFTATGGTLLDNYVLPTTAIGLGTITQAILTASIVGIPTRTYDATTAITLGPTDYALSGFVTGEGATITETAGTFASPDAGIRQISATLEGTDFVPIGGTLLGNYQLPTIATGPGLIERAILAASVINNPTKTYDGTTVATLASSNYELTGFVAGQGATVTETVGTYASPNVGSRMVTVALGSADFVADAGTSLLNYVLPTSASGLGTIDPATLTAAIIGNPTKVYDGNTDAMLTSANYQLTGFVFGEGATVTETFGTYSLKDVGSRTVTATLDSTDFAATGSTLLTNYVLPTSASGLGTITWAMLNAAIIGNPTKSYDGTTAATLTSANYALTGFVAGEGATITQTMGDYGDPNAGIRTVTASLAPGDFTATGATLLSNYTLPTSAIGLGTIDQATLAAAIIGNPTKVYDGNAAIALTPANYALTGFIAGESATIDQPDGMFDSANAGARTVTASLGLANFTATGSTSLGNYVLPTSASGPGTIDPATLAVAIVGNPTRAYNGTALVALTPANFALTGFMAGEGATVTQPLGLYADPNAGLHVVSAALMPGDFAPEGGTLLANYVLPTSASGLGTITRAVLDAAIIGNPTKTYDGTALAELNPPNFDLTGFVLGEGATVTQRLGTYDSPNAGDRIVSANLTETDFTANAGTLLSNYVLPASATGAGTILQRPISSRELGAEIVNDPTKVYDGTRVATLTPQNFLLSGFVGTDGAIITRTEGLYALADAGGHVITTPLAPADFTPTGGTLLSNYLLPERASGPGTILQATLDVAIIGNPTRAYDGTTTAALAPGNYQLTGFVAGEGATVTQSAGTYDSASAGPRTVTASLAALDYLPESGTRLSNYILPTSATGPGTIDPALLAVAIVGNPTRVYDATTAAALTSANYQLTGFIAGEGATVTQAVGAYDTANAGSRTITASLAAGDYTPGTGTELGNYVLPTEAIGPGTITPKELTLLIVGAQDKVYDGTTLATLSTDSFRVVGFVGAQGIEATGSTIPGTYSGADVGPHTIVVEPTTRDFAPLAGTDLANYVLRQGANGFGRITPAPLTAAIIGNPTRTYDGTAAATLAPANFGLTGFVSGQGATVTRTAGTYDSANAGSRTVTASLAPADFTASAGTQFSNYILPTSATGPGTIDRAALTVAIVGNPTKPYDANTDAALMPGNYALSGFIAGEGATITQPFGTYASPEPGEHEITAALAPDNYAADAGTLLSNYNLPVEAEGPGTITAPAICPSVSDCLPDDLAFAFAASRFTHFYIVYPSTSSRFQGQVNAFGGLPSIMTPPAFTRTSTGWVLRPGSPVVNSAEQILSRGGESVEIEVRYTPPRPSVELGEALP